MLSGGLKSVKSHATSEDLLFFLPCFAAELNPAELVWSYTKGTGTAKRRLASDQMFQNRIEPDLFKIQNNPALVRSSFKEPDVGYYY